MDLTINNIEAIAFWIFILLVICFPIIFPYILAIIGNKLFGTRTTVDVSNTLRGNIKIKTKTSYEAIYICPVNFKELEREYSDLKEKVKISPNNNLLYIKILDSKLRRIQYDIDSQYVEGIISEKRKERDSKRIENLRMDLQNFCIKNNIEVEFEKEVYIPIEKLFSMDRAVINKEEIEELKDIFQKRIERKIGQNNRN